MAALRADREALRAALAEAGLAGAPLGADPARPVARCNPHPRYVAMEQHFAARGCAAPGRAMMSATAALQVNLDAGPSEGWSARLAHLRALVPMLVAASATSPYLGGRSSGWHSMRQETWDGIDHGAQRPDPGGGADGRVGALRPQRPGDAAAPRRRGERRARRTVPVTSRVSFADWLREPGRLGRPATRSDLDYHLTTLFPPVRPRGYLEIRCIDALPDRWWPALAALTVALVDDPVAADLAAELCEPVTGAWETAARHGLADPAVRGRGGRLRGGGRPPRARGPPSRGRGLRRAGRQRPHAQRRAARARRRRRTRPPAGGGSPCVTTAARGLEDARVRSLALTDLDEPELTAQHSPLMSPLVWDLAHIGQQEDLWLLRGGDAHAQGVLSAQVERLYDAFEHPRAERVSLPLLTPREARSFIADVRGRVLEGLERVGSPRPPSTSGSSPT